MSVQALWDEVVSNTTTGNATRNAANALLRELIAFGLPDRDTAFRYWEYISDSYIFAFTVYATIGCARACTRARVRLAACMRMRMRMRMHASDHIYRY